MKSTSLKLKPVDPKCFSDLGFLYGVLERRLKEPWANISHKAMPSWDDHVKYVGERSAWGWRHEIIYCDQLYVGVIYVDSDNCIGIYISPEHRRHGIGKWALQQIIDTHPFRPLRANINPSNDASKNFFGKAGFVLHRTEKQQDVYERIHERTTVS